MASIFAVDMQRSRANLNLHISTDDKFRFVETNILTSPKCHQVQIWAQMLSMTGTMTQEQEA